jgi:hypothetical protein
MREPLPTVIMTDVIIFDRGHLEAVLAEFVEDNPLACEGILSVARLEYTTSIPTLAVTLQEDPPRLLINPEFVASHIQTEHDLRAVLLHEFLHVLLGHTQLFSKNDPATNLALDAVINHIVQRELGEATGEFFRRYYTPTGDGCPLWLLRPHAPGDIQPKNPWPSHHYGPFRKTPAELKVETLRFERVGRIHNLRSGLAKGTVLADDVLDILETLTLDIPEGILLLGHHGEQGPAHPANLERLDRLFKQLDGSGIFRHPSAHGVGPDPFSALWSEEDPARNWCRQTTRILKKLLVPHPRSRPVLNGRISFHLPVANQQDRRAALRSLWNPLVPDFEWHTGHWQPRGQAHVYLDVSGSMNEELNLLTGLLWRLRQWIQSPFYAFSNGVAPAKLVRGKLETHTTGGTCFNDVLEHILRHRPQKSLIITDGYIEKPCPKLLRQLKSKGETIHVLVSAHGTAEPFDRHGISRSILPNILKKP